MSDTILCPQNPQILRDSATEALTLEIIELLQDRTLLPSGHDVYYAEHHFQAAPVASGSVPGAAPSVGVVELEVYTTEGMTPVRITVEAISADVAEAR